MRELPGYSSVTWGGLHTGDAFRGKSLSQALDMVGFHLVNGFIGEEEAEAILIGYIQKRRSGFYAEGSDSILQKVGQALAFIPIPQAQMAAVGLQAAGQLTGADSGALVREIPWSELDQMAHDVREAIWGIEHSRLQHPEGLPLSLDLSLRHLKDLIQIIETYRGYGTDSSGTVRIPWDDINAMWDTLNRAVGVLTNLKTQHLAWATDQSYQHEVLEPTMNNDIQQTLAQVTGQLDAVRSTLSLIRGT